jgi:hypothetical protein
MDMNYLSHRRGEERLRAHAAANPPARAAHLELADRYGSLIRDARQERTARFETQQNR